MKRLLVLATFLLIPIFHIFSLYYYVDEFFLLQHEDNQFVERNVTLACDFSQYNLPVVTLSVERESDVIVIAYLLLNQDLNGGHEILLIEMKEFIKWASDVDENYEHKSFSTYSQYLTSNEELQFQTSFISTFEIIDGVPLFVISFTDIMDMDDNPAEGVELPRLYFTYELVEKFLNKFSVKNIKRSRRFKNMIL